MKLDVKNKTLKNQIDSLVYDLNAALNAGAKLRYSIKRQQKSYRGVDVEQLRTELISIGTLIECSIKSKSAIQINLFPFLYPGTGKLVK